MPVIELKNRYKKSPKRLGRGPGSGLGKTSGRGNKGQKARAGGGVRRGFEGGQMPLYRRLPKRGFRNPFRKIYQIVQLSDIVKNIEGVVDQDALLVKGLVHARDNTYVKVLCDVKELTKKIELKVNAVSQSCRDLVEKAGGKVEIIERALKKGQASVKAKG